MSVSLRHGTARRSVEAQDLVFVALRPLAVDILVPPDSIF